METSVPKPSKWRLAAFIMRTRALMLISGDENKLLNIGRIAILLVLLLYGSFGAWALLTLETHQRIVIESAVLMSMAFIIFFSGVFPIIRFPVRIIPAYAPVSERAAGGLNLLYNTTRPGTVYGIFFLAVLSLLSYSLGPWLFLDGIFLIVAASALDFGIKHSVQLWRASRQTGSGGLISAEAALTAALAAFSSLSFAGLYFWFRPVFYDMMPWTGTVLMFTSAVSAAAFFMFLTQRYAEIRHIRVTNESGALAALTAEKSSVAGYAAKLYNRRDTSRQLYLVIPVILVLGGAYLYLIQGHMPAYIAYLLAIPLLPFSYLHNNFWGFFPELWMSQSLSPQARKTRWLFYTGSLWRVLLWYAVLAFPVLFFIGMFEWKQVLLFVLLCPPALLTGYWASLRFPKKVRDGSSVISFSRTMNNTSGLVSFIETSVFFGLAYLMISGLFAVFTALYLLMLLILWLMVRKIENQNQFGEQVSNTLLR
ncbi:MAG: hypothetical protein JJU35_12335 [Balneolales bacterium]|nr:hypothetical protein [Balneolales bacterium]